MGHARALLSIEDDKRRIELAKKILQEDWSVRDIEKMIQKAGPQRKGKQKKIGSDKNLDPNIVEALNRLQYKLGTAVILKSKADAGQRGRIEIAYYSGNDLTRIFDLLLMTK
jgi:ParB family chromosome partitioning protein